MRFNETNQARIAAPKPFAQLVLLALITLAAAALRLYKLGEWSFWIDEIITVGRARAAVEPPVQLLPLSTVLIGSSYSLFGISEWSSRLVPAAVGIVTIPLLYFPIRRLWGAVVALFSVLLLAVSPWHILWSQNSRFYTTLLLFYTLALLALLLAVRERRRQLLYLAMALLFLWLATVERLFALFLVPVAGLFLTVMVFAQPDAANRRRLLRLLAIGVLAPALLFAGYELFNLALNRVTLTGRFIDIFVGSSNKNVFRFALSYVYRLGIPTLVLGSIGALYAIWRRDSASYLLLISAFLPPLLLTAITPFVFTVDRYAFVSLVSWLILAALALEEVLAQKGRAVHLFAWGVFLLLVGVSIGDDFLYYRYENGGRPDWKGAFALVAQQYEDGDIVFATRPEIGNYYLDRQVRFLSWANMEEAEGEGERTWYVISTSMSGIDPALLKWVEENSELIAVLDVPTPGNVLDMRVRLQTSAPLPQPDGNRES